MKNKDEFCEYCGARIDKLDTTHAIRFREHTDEEKQQQTWTCWMFCNEDHMEKDQEKKMAKGEI